jgi:aspartate/methionine/tyrosine aminotransferase
VKADRPNGIKTMLERIQVNAEESAEARPGIEPFRAMAILAAARSLQAEGRSICHLELGEPAILQPHPVQRAVALAMLEGRTGYTQALGLPSLRAAIGALYQRRYGIDVPIADIAVTTGSSAGFVLAFLACFSAGQRIAIPNPGYPAYRNILKSLDLVPVAIETGPETDYVMTPEALQEAARQGPIHGVLIMSPANPTGVTMSRRQVEAIAAFCQDRGIPLISDEIYHGLAFDHEAATAYGMAEDVLVINSFSKFHAMTGWRIGWMIMPPARRAAVERLAMNLYLSPPALSQAAAEAALKEGDFYEALAENYAAARDYLSEALPRIGFTPWPMDGAFYAYCDVSLHSNDAEALCRAALEEAGVAMTPGIDFDPSGGQSFVRISYAAGETVAREGIARLSGWLANRRLGEG